MSEAVRGTNNKETSSPVVGKRSEPARRYSEETTATAVSTCGPSVASEDPSEIPAISLPPIDNDRGGATVNAGGRRRQSNSARRDSLSADISMVPHDHVITSFDVSDESIRAVAKSPTMPSIPVPLNDSTSPVVSPVSTAAGANGFRSTGAFESPRKTPNESPGEGSMSSSTTDVHQKLAAVEKERDQLRERVEELRRQLVTKQAMPEWAPSTIISSLASQFTLSNNSINTSSTRSKVSFIGAPTSSQNSSTRAPTSSRATPPSGPAPERRGRNLSQCGPEMVSASFNHDGDASRSTTPQQSPQQAELPAVVHQVHQSPPADATPGGNPRRVKASSPPLSSVRQSAELDLSASAGPLMTDLAYGLSLNVNRATMNPTRNVRMGALIGQGGYSKVFMGLNLDTGELMAVKVMEFELCDMAASWWKSRLDALKTEIDVMKDLHHPNIVQYLFSSTDPGSGTHVVNIFMEYVPGGSMYKVIKDFGKLPEITVSYYVSQLVDAMAYMHERGVVHMDIKSANILLTAGGAMKLADFGTALVNRSQDLKNKAKHSDPMSPPSPSKRAAEEKDGSLGSSGANSTSSIRGTLQYMAPEVIREDPNCVSAPADIWSLGCVVMEMLTGHPPWTHLKKENIFSVMSEHAENNGPVELPDDEDLTPEAKSFLAVCLEKNPKNRATAESLRGHAFLDQVGSIVAHRGVSSASMLSLRSNRSNMDLVLQSFGNSFASSYALNGAAADPTPQ